MPLRTEDANQDGYFVGPTIFAEVKRGMQIYVPRYHQKTVDETGQVCAFNPDKAVAGSANQKPRFIDSDGPVFRFWWARIDIDEFL